MVTPHDSGNGGGGDHGGDHEHGDCHGGDHQDLQHYQGSVTAVDTTLNTITVQWTHVNSTAQAWLDGHSDPNPVTIGISTTTRIERDGGSAIQVRDRVELEASPSVDLSSLVAVVVEAQAGH